MKQYLTLALLLAVAWGGAASAGERSNRNPLSEDAEQWLRMLDEEKYEEAWQQTTTLFRSAMSYDYFLRFAKHVRRPVTAGALRVVEDEALRNDMPGLPYGPYFDVTFEATSPTKRTGSSEHIILAPDGCQWKVTSYELK
jgi:hypothetical protein